VTAPSPTCLAAVAYPDGTVRPERFPVPEVADGAALLEVEASGVCGTDLELLAGGLDAPVILGHHVVGRLHEVGEAAGRDWRLGRGQRVVVEEYLPCGACEACRGEGTYRFCPDTDLFGGGRRVGLVPVSVPPSLWGGNAELLALPANAVLHPVPDDLNAQDAVWTLPLANAFDWTAGSAELPGASVVVVGPGLHGLCAVVAARLCGASTIVVAGLPHDRPRLAMARELGATDVVENVGDGLLDAVRAATGGQGADLVVHTAGPDVAASTTLVRRLGTLVLAGIGGTTPLDGAALVRGAVTVRGVRGRDPRWVTRALEELAAGTTRLESVPTRTVAIDGVGHVYDAMRHGELSATPHVVVRP
jgi:threonine dehydrogenase-like Zn-dependent dehydrogenase